ncbi:MAG: phage tail tape measure protein [Leptospiraceae bacterium]|nr:phage tail tape measure protein [Leptospiraceae bacterium]
MNEVFKLGVILSAQDLASSKIGAITDKWEQMKKSFQDSSDIQNSMNKLENGIYSIQKGVISLGVGMSILKKLPINEARSFEKELGLLQATSNATAEEMVRLKEAAIQAGMKTQFSPDQAAAGLTALASAGMNATNSIKALDATLALASASAGKLSIDQAAADIAATVNTFRRSADDVADTFTRMANISSFTIQDLGSAWRGVNAIASGMNQSMEETALMLSAVKRAGFTTAESGEKVRMALEALAAPSKKAQKEMEKLGVKAYDQNGKFKSVIKIMDEMREAFQKKGLSEEKQNKALSKILLSGGSQAYRALMALSDEERKNWINKLNDKQGATKKFAKTQQETYEGISVTLEGVLATFKVVFGDALLPILKSAKMGLINVLTPLLEFLKTHPALVKYTMSFIAFSGVVLMGAGAIKALLGVKQLFVAITILSKNATFMEAAANSTLGTTIKALTVAKMRETIATNGGILASIRLSAIQTVLAIKMGIITLATKAWTVAQWLLNAALTANPIALVIAAVAALGLAIYGLVKHIQSVPGEVEKSNAMQMKAMESEKTALEKKLEKYQKQEQLLQSLGLVGEKAYTDLQSKIEQTKKKIEDMNDALAQSNGMLASLIKARSELEAKMESKKMLLDVAIASGDKNAIKKIQTEYDQLKETLQNTNKEIQNQKDLPANLQAVVSELDRLHKAKKIIDTEMPEAKNSKTYKDIEEQIQKGEANLKLMEIKISQIAQVSGSKFIETFAKSMGDEFPSLYKRVSGGLGGLMDYLNRSDAKKGPLSKVSHSGKMFLKTWGAGFESGKSALFSSVESTLGKVKGYLDFSSLAGSLTLESPVSLEKVLKSGEAIVQTLATGVKNSANTLYEAIKNVFKKSWKLFTQSDAKEGPFSRITYSGKALINTFAEGSEQASPKLHSSIQKSFGEANEIIQKTPYHGGGVTRTEPGSVQNTQTTNNAHSNILNFEYFIKEFNISGKDGENSFGQLIENLIYEELSRKEAYL